MPVGTAQCILEHCKIGVHGTTGFHFSPSFLIVRCFLLVSEVQSVCENVALPFVTPMHTPLHNHSINNCGFKTSDPFCSPWKNKHQILFCPLSTLFFNIRISAVVSSYPRSSRTRPNISQIALQPGKGGGGGGVVGGEDAPPQGFAAWTTQESCQESRNHHSGLVETIDFSLKGFSGGSEGDILSQS